MVDDPLCLGLKITALLFALLVWNEYLKIEPNGSPLA